MIRTMDLAGKRILVVGGARGLGAEIACSADRNGAEVIVGARDLPAAKALAKNLQRGNAVRLDVLDEASVAAAAADLGAIDHVVSTASMHHDVPVADLEHDKIVAAFGAKVFGPLLLAKHFASRLRAGGSLLLFSGIVGWKPKPGTVVKGVANGAMEYLVAHLATELAPLRVNAIAPGIVDSGAWDPLGEQGKAELLARAANGTLVGRHGEPSDIADAALWLLSAGFVTGEVIHVDGGARQR
jgi:NAD(P)-dependent dehydrogenase (short-subunit alcohol dehydrogenase family)